MAFEEAADEDLKKSDENVIDMVAILSKYSNSVTYGDMDSRTCISTLAKESFPRQSIGDASWFLLAAYRKM